MCTGDDPGPSREWRSAGCASHALTSASSSLLRSAMRDAGSRAGTTNVACVPVTASPTCNNTPISSRRPTKGSSVAFTPAMPPHSRGSVQYRSTSPRSSRRSSAFDRRARSIVSAASSTRCRTCGSRDTSRRTNSTSQPGSCTTNRVPPPPPPPSNKMHDPTECQNSTPLSSFSPVSVGFSVSSASQRANPRPASASAAILSRSSSHDFGRGSPTCGKHCRSAPARERAMRSFLTFTKGSAAETKKTCGDKVTDTPPSEPTKRRSCTL
mmetsp:Transcript_4945/g.17182  ORF Transcript_4945/g.17182 Transcript_4945/m.17182 type:complete len:268 (-) Transcript_4945:388-1191(-)